MNPHSGGPSSELAEAGIELRVLYPDEEPTLGVLASDLAEIDRALRDAIRHLTGAAERGPLAGWPSLQESARVRRATTNSPLEIVSAIVLGILANFATDAIKALFRDRLNTRLADRPKSRSSIHVGVTIEVNRESGEPPEVAEEEWDWPQTG